MYIAERCVADGSGEDGEWIEVDDKLYHDLSDAIAAAKKWIKPTPHGESAVRVWDTKKEDVVWNNFESKHAEPLTCWGDDSETKNKEE